MLKIANLLNRKSRSHSGKGYNGQGELHGVLINEVFE